MRKKIFFIISILVIAVFLGPRLFFISIGLWQYYQTDVVCTGKNPTPPSELGRVIYMPLYKITSYILMTGQAYSVGDQIVMQEERYIYPGDEIKMPGETWGGSAVLLWVGESGATFVVDMSGENNKGKYVHTICRWFAPLQDDY